MEDPTYERAKAVRAEGAKKTERTFTLYCVSDDNLEENSFEEKESLDKLISIGEKSRVSVGNESSTVRHCFLHCQD